MHFTLKETDIYRIHQSGDLANLDGLEDAALEKLPSLLRLRDALYSPLFREYIAQITQAGPLSGSKTDMAVNVYMPGCHLLCHDDVIGSRRVSYILYLTDPDVPWREEWGGALRLYPTMSVIDEQSGEEAKVPSPQWERKVPPAWNQLAFFAVRPGQSFHDVEEVYHSSVRDKLQAEDSQRVRMAISGWYHIPQVGEEGYVPGAEAALAVQSSLAQLQGKDSRFDLPQARPVVIPPAADEEEREGLEEEEIEFLLRFLAPSYLTPDTLEAVAAQFGDESAVTLEGILNEAFGEKLRAWIVEQEQQGGEGKGMSGWQVARPPHKQRFLFLQGPPLPSTTPTTIPSNTTASNGAASEDAKQEKGLQNGDEELNPLRALLCTLLPSPAFQTWLSLATGCRLHSHDLVARRFRRGEDYALAMAHVGLPRLELCLGITPGGEGAMEEEDEKEEQEKEADGGDGEMEEEEDDVGGQEIYMAADSDNDDDDEDDAAVYKSSKRAYRVNSTTTARATEADTDTAKATEPEPEPEPDPVPDAESSNLLFVSPPAWNSLALVLRDERVLRFVKYRSRRAPTHRWDVGGVWEVRDEAEDGGGDGEGEESR